MKYSTPLFLLILISLSGLSRAKTQVYFSPQGQCEEEVVSLINKSNKTIDIAMYSLNNSQILEALEQAKQRGVVIRLLLDRVQAFGNHQISLQLKDEEFNVRIHSKNKIQHNKFAIFDNHEIITGSFNWTNAAQNFNEENCLILDEPDIVSAYETRFDDHLWKVNTEDKSLKYFDKMKLRN